MSLRNRSSSKSRRFSEAALLQSHDADPKDRFTDLAEAALDEADMEEEQKGVIQEVVEALIARSGAPLVAEVISEQLRSQDVIERLAESHEEQRQRLRKRPSSPDSVIAPNILKEPVTEPIPEEAAAHEEEVEPVALLSEYLWRLFRLLLLASIVGLIIHFVYAHSYETYV
ncbi:uncharacterized protein BYT42DRAFT_498692 [Radiomyces spectabilis]|uniref:uncharacterized protein n=1 Tax=Radiomyces spectabilis TaxID=64574 RepID=UPI00221E6526|nr:uncharacterized protein BYT42DRAFT_498692 [Radiomyces spectabilis]KAI8376227.1 hypothetical protein BYT42DRAFT_498692 [Radiomyces spectabilis]